MGAEYEKIIILQRCIIDFVRIGRGAGRLGPVADEIRPRKIGDGADFHGIFYAILPDQRLLSPMSSRLCFRKYVLQFAPDVYIIKFAA